jgi:hypothetical protein
MFKPFYANTQAFYVNTRSFYLNNQLFVVRHSAILLNNQSFDVNTKPFYVKSQSFDTKNSIILSKHSAIQGNLLHPCSVVVFPCPLPLGLHLGRLMTPFSSYCCALSHVAALWPVSYKPHCLIEWLSVSQRITDCLNKMIMYLHRMHECLHKMA